MCPGQDSAIAHGGGADELLALLLAWLLYIPGRLAEAGAGLLTAVPVRCCIEGVQTSVMTTSRNALPPAADRGLNVELGLRATIQ